MSTCVVRSHEFCNLSALLLSFGLLHVPFNAVVIAQEKPQADVTAPVIFTTQQDHQNMLQQLGITKLRPGRNADEKSPNAANYDESKANPYPELPQVLKSNDGSSVTTAEQWWKVRRPEIVEMLEREIYGRVPADVPSVKWEVRRLARFKPQASRQSSNIS